jgi:hypothetical protein
MNKTKMVLTIGKLFGTAIALSIVLIGTVAIEGLQAAVRYATSTITKLNKPQESVAILSLVGSELRRAEPDLAIQSLQNHPTVGRKTLSSAIEEIPFIIPTWLGTVNVSSEDIKSSEIALTMPKQITNLILSSVIEPFKMPINPYREIIKQLPRDILNLKYLKNWAKYQGIKGYSKMSKAKLVAALTPA